MWKVCNQCVFGYEWSNLKIDWMLFHRRYTYEVFHLKKMNTGFKSYELVFSEDWIPYFFLGITQFVCWCLSSNLIFHIQKHTGYKPFTCNFCIQISQVEKAPITKYQFLFCYYRSGPKLAIFHALSKREHYIFDIFLFGIMLNGGRAWKAADCTEHSMFLLWAKQVI